jgi:putative efflux protein, MATE family
MPGKSILLSLTRQLLFLVPGILLLPHLAEGWLSPSDGVWLSIPIADGAAALLSGTMLVVQLRQLRRSAA